uniref:Uncharacterized protein n=1 Tax=Timema poppense TaxID=170557 RepID=A0A7R9D7Z5_TIMPO|nr:unnamed protein product [Timema poppensis]
MDITQSRKSLILWPYSSGLTGRKRGASFNMTPLALPSAERRCGSQLHLASRVTPNHRSDGDHWTAAPTNSSHYNVVKTVMADQFGALSLRAACHDVTEECTCMDVESDEKEVFKARDKKNPKKFVAMKKVLMDNEKEGIQEVHEIVEARMRWYRHVIRMEGESIPIR